jgi:hypothetical protein
VSDLTRKHRVYAVTILIIIAIAWIAGIATLIKVWA